MIIDKRFRLARIWSNQELSKLAPLFDGDVVNVSAWDDRDKEGRSYRDYFINAKSYSYTNYIGYRGFQGLPNEYYLDLMEDVPDELKRKFDVVFNHTTLEHIFEVQKAISTICELTRDIVIVIVPFAQVQHESESWQDYWRFTPSCLRRLFMENNLSVIYESESPHKRAAIYLTVVASRDPDRWRNILPKYKPINNAGSWIGSNILLRAFSAMFSILKK
ncbi:MAG TPA: hypothetical protein PLV84_01060 [Deltaproteobacteria bacterium]|nr:hypothetical protein [Deltaproteobacteria bacterium]